MIKSTSDYMAQRLEKSEVRTQIQVNSLLFSGQDKLYGCNKRQIYQEI